MHTDTLKYCEAYCCRFMTAFSSIEAKINIEKQQQPNRNASSAGTHEKSSRDRF